MPPKLQDLLLSGESPVIGPKTAQRLQEYLDNIPELPLASETDIEQQISLLSLAISGKRPSKEEALALLDIFKMVLKHVAKVDLQNGVTALLGRATFIPTPAEVLKAPLPFKAKREFVISRARHLIWKQQSR
ncbi:hypothetical protein [Altericroceibacterium indicum]|uniref:hypothetical protein n=1 Tax=Altericroceibacterium indicum TaxID=374177 RepID=UPI003CCD3C6A